jgi:hypothetical protein
MGSLILPLASEAAGSNDCASQWIKIGWSAFNVVGPGI